MTQNAIEITGLNKIYKGTKKSAPKHALKDVDLRIPKGSIFGLLGPNGAGKSTIINIMAGLVTKTAGQVKIWDIDIDEDRRSAKAAIGVVPQEINYDPFFSPRALLELQGGLYGVPKTERRTDEILALVGLSDKATSYARSLSGGMRRRLMIAKAMVHSPPILVLDEPTAGVDVELRRQLWNNVRALNEQGVTILLTTHYLEEAEELCDQIAIINHGQIVACEDKADLLSRIENKALKFTTDQDVKTLPEELIKLGAELEGTNTLTFRYNPAEINAGQIITALQNTGLGICDLQSEQSDLEDIFLQLTQAA